MRKKKLGQSVYKQLPSSDDYLNARDLTTATVKEESVFITCLVPLQLKVVETGQILWTCPKPGSPNYCRPVRIRFIKETKETIEEEEKQIEKEIIETNEKFIEVQGFSVDFEYHMSMLDGKCTTILSKETNCYASCPICGIKAAEMKDKEKIEAYKKKVKPENLKYCLSTLHCWIRSFEFLLHVGYKSRVKTWQIKKNTIEHDMVQARKSEIKNELYQKFGLKVDQPRADGAGNSNDGNCARTFFKNYQQVSQILDVNEEIVKRIYVILCLVCCKSEVDIPKFKQYCEDTQDLILREISWHPTSSSVH